MEKTFLKSLAKDSRILECISYLVNSGFMRVVNYHNTDIQDLEKFENEIKTFSEKFSSVSLADVDDYFDSGVWKKEKPGLIPVFFEGFRDHYELILPILNKYKVKGWFYIPSFFMDVPVPEQLKYTEDHKLDISRPQNHEDGRYALTWDEVREIAENHEICCHTGSHFEITKDTSEEDMYREIVLSKRKLEEEIGSPVDVFCWLYGEEYSYNKKAQPFLKQAGYRYVVSNLKIERLI